MQRRSFLASSLVLPATIVSANTLSSSIIPAHSGRFRISLKADAIGVDGSADDLLLAAEKYGYEALSVSAQWLEGWTNKQKADFVKKAKKKNISWGASGLPVEFRRTEQQFRSDLGSLDQHAKNLADIGVTRIGTWIISGHATLTYNENMRQHAGRLRDCARILRKYGISLGLEYIGTPSFRHNARFAFISTGRELKEMIALIGEPNVGVILDSYHWHTAEETVADLLIWKNEEIVAVDLNDANRQLKLVDQTDLARELPGATGVIDLDGFIKALVKIGYDGPVRAEPFSTTLNQMSNELALAATRAAVLGAVTKAVG